MSSARLLSSVPGHPERFIVGGGWGFFSFFFKSGRILGATANFKADTSHHPQPTGSMSVWNEPPGRAGQDRGLMG